ncbi:unnamed protein product [Lota lota]
MEMDPGRLGQNQQNSRDLPAFPHLIPQAYHHPHLCEPPQSICVLSPSARGAWLGAKGQEPGAKVPENDLERSSAKELGEKEDDERGSTSRPTAGSLMSTLDGVVMERAWFKGIEFERSATHPTLLPASGI